MSEPRRPLEEVARGVFSGKAFRGATHTVVVLAGDIGERCEIIVDGRPLRARSYQRCMAAMMARMMRVAGTTKARP